MQQSRGWVHYAIHRPEPHIMLYRCVSRPASARAFFKTTLPRLAANPAAAPGGDVAIDSRRRSEMTPPRRAQDSRGDGGPHAVNAVERDDGGFRCCGAKTTIVKNAIGEPRLTNADATLT